tara:strand:+ start:2640 stop:3176 length:537 start_codon:yes stop_codon:yes gene_type:complete
MSSLGSIIEALKQGNVIAYPTEGVWGLGCDPLNEAAVLKLISLKNRSKDKGLILIGSDINQFSDFVDIDRYKDELLSKWPGPHTWLVPAKEKISKLITGNSNKIALRLSSHKEVIDICDKFESAIISSSANKENSPTLGTSEEIRKAFPEVLVLQGELGGLNRPSKIQDLVTGTYVRG